VKEVRRPVWEMWGVVKIEKARVREAEAKRTSNIREGVARWAITHRTWLEFPIGYCSVSNKFLIYPCGKKANPATL
jgi:hypothetical protein